MTDQALNYFLSSGTNAERLAFTPDPATPASGPDPSYVWVETDTNGLFAWDFGSKAWIAVAGSGTVTKIATGTGLTGGPITGSGTVSLASIADERILANVSGGSAAPVATSLTTILDTLATTQGDVIYRGKSAWVALAPGTSGDVLTSGGAAANPAWLAPTTGSVTKIDAGTGLTGGPITSTGTLSLDPISDQRLLANFSGGSAAPTPTTMIAALEGLSTTQGVVAYRGASAWTVLAPGTKGQFLTTGGAAANPSWTTAAGSGTVTSITAGTGLSGGTITASGTIDLANTAVVAGSYTATNLTVDAQGRITKAANGVAGTVTSVASGTGLTGGPVTSTGTISLDLSSANKWTGLQTLSVGADITPAAAPSTTAVGYLGAPRNIGLDSGNVTLAISDSGKFIYHTDGNARDLTIPANGSVAFAIGTVIAGVNANGAGIITLKITTDTLRWGSSTGQRTIAANASWSLLKEDTTTWRLTGDGIT